MATTKKPETFYLVSFRDPRDGQIRSIKAKTIRDSTLGLSFVSISEFLFETGSLVVNPAEEYQKQRFENVKSFHLSIYSIISIEEIGMEHSGLNFKKDKSNLVALPNSAHTKGPLCPS